jgi:hypothetical protein
MGKNLEVTEGGWVARRLASFRHTSAFITNALMPCAFTIGDEVAFGYKITVTILEKEDWAGGLKLGFTFTDPSPVAFQTIHLTDVPNSISIDFDWATMAVTEITELKSQKRHAQHRWHKKHSVGDVVSFAYCPNQAKFFVEFNSEPLFELDEPEIWKARYDHSNGQVWGLLEPYGQTKTVRLSPIPLIASWTPTTHHMYPIQTRQAIKTLMILAMPSRDGYSRFDDRGLNMLYLLPNELLFMIFQMLVVAAAR